MADANVCRDEASEGWALINFHLNQNPMVSDELLAMRNSEETVSNQKCSDVLELETYSEIPHHKVKPNDTIISGPLHESLEKLEIITLITKKNSNCERNSDDEDSIEVLDLDGSCRDADLSELETPDTSDVGFIGIHDLGQGTCANDCIAFETRLRKRKLSKIDKTGTYTHISDSRNCAGDEERADEKDKDEKKEEEEAHGITDLTIALYNSKFSPVYDCCSSRFKNAAVSLSLGIIFAGIACIVIGHILGKNNSTIAMFRVFTSAILFLHIYTFITAVLFVVNKCIRIANKVRSPENKYAETIAINTICRHALLWVSGVQNSADDLLVIVRKLKLENAALQSQLSQINAALLREGKPTQYFHERKRGHRLEFDWAPTGGTFKCEKSSDYFFGVDLENDKKGQSNVKSSGSHCEHIVSLGNLARYIEEKVNLFNETNKDPRMRHLEDCTGKITQALQAAVDKLASFLKNLDDIYNKLDLFLSEIQSDGGRKSHGDKRQVNNFFIGTKTVDFVGAKNRTRESAQYSVIQYAPVQFPQPEEYYIEKDKNGARGKDNVGGIGEEYSETSKTSADARAYVVYKNGQKRNMNDGVWMNRNEREENESKKGKKMAAKSYGKERKTMLAEKGEKLGKSKKRGGKNWKGSKNSAGYRLEEGRSSLSRGKSIRKSGLWVFKWAEARAKIRKEERSGNGKTENGKAVRQSKRLNGLKHLTLENSHINW